MICQILTGVLLFSGCSDRAPQPGISVSVTYVNYLNATSVEDLDARTDRGYRLVSPAYLGPSSNRYSGATVSSTGSGSILPKWIDFTWKEFDLANKIPNDAWGKLDEAAQQAYFRKKSALPLKRQRVAVRELVPDDVLTELEQSPMDPVRTSLRLKTMELFFIWTDAGLKVRWMMYQGGSSIIHEGGDIVPER